MAFSRGACRACSLAKLAVTGRVSVAFGLDATLSHFYDSPPHRHSTNPSINTWKALSRSMASEASSSDWGSSWLPSWLRFPGTGGGSDGADEFSSMTLDTFRKNLGRARMAGALTGMVGGSKAGGSQQARAQLQAYEDIINAMTSEERSDPSKFGPAERMRVAAAVKCNKAQVDDCINKFNTMNKLLATLSERKKAGKPLPNTIDEIGALLGESGWNGTSPAPRKGSRAMSLAMASAASTPPPKPYLGPDGQPCPLAGKSPGRNDVCPATGNKYKRCCGKGQ